MIDFVENTDELVDELGFEDLKEFLYRYDMYVSHFFDEHDEGSEPVCMVEYFNNDFQELMNGNDEDEE